MLIKVISLWTLLVWSSLAMAAETNPFKLPFGEPYELEAEVPVQIDFPMILYLSFMVPMPDEANLAMFTSYQLLYEKNSGAIYSVQATQPFESATSCQAAESAAISTLEQNFPLLENPAQGRFVSEEFEVSVYCAFREGARFIELSFAIFHLPTRV